MWRSFFGQVKRRSYWSLDFSKGLWSGKPWAHDTMFRKKQNSRLMTAYITGRRRINASVVQGSGMGQTSYSIAESDLKPKNSFQMHKFADDVDLITTIDHYDEIEDEEHVGAWAEKNNLVLDKSKTWEMIIGKGRPVILPPPTLGIERWPAWRNSESQYRATYQWKITSTNWWQKAPIWSMPWTYSEIMECKEESCNRSTTKNTIQDHLRIACLIWNGKSGKI